jgi:hypothetical protein
MRERCGRSAEASVNYNSAILDTDASNDVPPVSGRRPMTDDPVTASHKSAGVLKITHCSLI